jgi:hypothetical protein
VANYLSFVLDDSDFPYVLFRYESKTGKAAVMNYNGSQWIYIGSEGISSSIITSYTSLKRDSNNVLYAGFTEYNSSTGKYNAVVKKYSGSWETILNLDSTESNYQFIDIEISSQDIPYISFALGDTVYVKKYVNSKWIDVGENPGLGRAYFKDIKLALDSWDNPYLAVVLAKNIYVHKYNGSTWSNLGSLDFIEWYSAVSLLGDDVDIDIDLNDTVYIAYRDYKYMNTLPPEYKATVKKYEQDYTPVYTAETPQITQQPEDKEVNLGENIVLETLAEVDEGTLTYHWYSNTTSSMEGASLITGAISNTYSPSTSQEGTIYYYCEITNTLETPLGDKTASTNTEVCYVNVTVPTNVWDIVGSAGFSDGRIDDVEVAVSDNGDIYAAFIDYDNDEAVVMEYTGGGITGWEVVGSKISTESNEINMTLYQDTIYIAYRDYVSVEEDGPKVVKFTKGESTDWETVGTGRVVEGYCYFLSIDTDTSGIPYISYRDMTDIDNTNTYGKGTVMKYTGSGTTGWQPVGIPGFTETYAEYTSIAIDSSDNVYVAYKVLSDGDKARVMKYDGTDWMYVGNQESPAISSGAAMHVDLNINSKDEPYVAFQDRANGYEATVLKYDGSDWVTVGDYGFTSSFSDSNVEYLDIQFDSNDNPYLGYSAQREYVVKYDGQWKAVGTLPANHDYYSDNNSTFVYDDTVYIGFRDGGNSDKLTVMRYVQGEEPEDEIISIPSITGLQPLAGKIPKANIDTLQFTGNVSWSPSDITFNYETTYTAEITLTPKEGYTLTGVRENFFEVEGALTTTNSANSNLVTAVFPETEASPPTPSPRPSIPKLVIETDELPDGIEGEEYEYQLEGDGGREPYTWGAESLPEGLEISEDGEILGTPEEAGTFNVKIEILDSRNYYRSKTLKLVIEEKEEVIENPETEVPEEEPDFLDILEHWISEYIDMIVERGIIFGYPDRTFKPDNKVTRGEFASMIIRTFDIEPIEGSLFDDTVDNWSESSINGAVGEGIITGYEDNTFRPNAPITREEMAVMISRALNIDEEVVEEYFDDIDTASPWAQLSISRLGNRKILTGFPDGTFRPKDTLTRAEAVKVIYEILKDLDELQ